MLISFFESFSLLNYQETLKPIEIDAINSFFEAYLELEFFSPDGYEDADEIVNFALAGYDVISFLEKLKSHSDNFSEIQKEMHCHIAMIKGRQPGLIFKSFDEWKKRENLCND